MADERINDFMTRVGAISNPEVKDDPLGFILRHYEYLARQVARSNGVASGYFCLRDTNGGILWEGEVTTQIADV